ncbi:MAG: hypothetical protein JWQ71_128 [Pedosphaera sp.]|nr:hypothetical protein [Pedosphaera sp.]
MINKIKCVRYVLVCLVSVILLAVAGCATSSSTSKSKLNDHDHRAEVLRGTFGTYCHAPHLPNGRVDVQRLVNELVDIHANTYSFCIHTSTNDWEDFQLFLPLARKHGIKVWGSVVPPSESPPHSKLYAEPFRLDYERWAVEFAKLSLREPSLVAWSIDDFTHNLKIYTPEHLKQMLDASRRVNPKLAFIPCCYYKAITPQFVQNYAPLLDGMLFPYRDESGGSNLKNPDAVEFEVNKIKELAGKSYPVVFDVYATAHSRLGATTPDYVEKAMISGKSCADGVLVYCHQDPIKNPEKYAIVKMLFGNWSANQKAAKR